MAKELTNEEKAMERFVGNSDEFEFIGMDDEVIVIEIEE